MTMKSHAHDQPPASAPHIGSTAQATRAAAGARSISLITSSRSVVALLLIGSLLSAPTISLADPSTAATNPSATPPSTQPSGRKDNPGGPENGTLRALFKRDRGPGGKDNPDVPELSPEQASQVIEAVREHFPLLADRLSESSKDNPDAVRNLLREYPRLAELIRLKKSDPKMFDLRSQDLRLEKQSRELVQQYRHAQKSNDKPKADALKNDLQRVIGDHFTLRQSIRELELQRLEQKLSQLKTQLETRKNSRDALVQSRLSELTDDGAQAEW
jgi:hypothetical protein